MKSSLFSLTMVMLTAFGQAQDAALAQRSTLGDAWWGGGSVNGSVSTAGEFVSGDFSVLVPLHSTLGQAGTLSGTLIFAEPYAQWVEQGSVQAGLGFGFRHLFGSQPLSALTKPQGNGFLDEGFYIGANVSFDMADTNFDQRFWQMGIGAEIGTRYLELRGRYFVPLGDGEETVERYSYSDSFHYSSPYVEAHSSFTFESVFTYLTESLEGYDLTASLLVPGLDRWMEARVIGGYAYFQGTTLDSIEYDSCHLGVELRPVPAVVLGATWFENEALVGDNWMFTLGFQLPFETADIGDGKGGFWGHIKDAFKPKRRHLAERLREPTRRYALPMQIRTGLKSFRETFSYEYYFSYILPDGTVVTVVDESGGSSYSAGYTGSATIISIGSTSDMSSTQGATLSLNGNVTMTSGGESIPANIALGSSSSGSTNSNSTDYTNSIYYLGTTTTGGTLNVAGGANRMTFPGQVTKAGTLVIDQQGTAPTGQTSSPP